MTGSSATFDCVACGRTIGPRALHHVLDDHRVVCTRCFTRRRAAHHDTYPDCTIRWHDLAGHSQHKVTTTRYGARVITEFWSRPQTTPPTLPGRRSNDGRTLLVDCPGCGRQHTHGRHTAADGCLAEVSDRNPCTCPTGTGDGHRAPHCGNGSMPRGYIVEEIRGDGHAHSATRTMHDTALPCAVHGRQPLRRASAQSMGQAWRTTPRMDRRKHQTLAQSESNTAISRAHLPSMPTRTRHNGRPHHTTRARRRHVGYDQPPVTVQTVPRGQERR